MVEQPQNSPKVLVIGLDGGNLEVFRRFADDGRMPFLKSVFDRGVSGTLESTIPPATPPAWCTFATGKNPGKHGVYSFFTYGNSVSRPRPVNSRSLKAETLWSLLSRTGKKVGVVNVPITYPPQPVNGTMITGLLTPSVEQTFTYPDDLYARLRDELGDYIIHVPWRDFPESKTLDYLASLRHCTEQRTKYVQHLMQHEPWDFFMVVFTEIDSLQHRCWSFLDPNDSRDADDKIETAIADYFSDLDGKLRRLCELAGDNSHVFFVSDHGFGPHLKQIHINTWLNELGLLTFNRRRLAVSRLKWKLRAWVRKLDRYHWRRRVSSGEIKQLDIASWIRWDRTKAFSFLTGEQGIRINTKGREPYGIVEPGAEYEQLRDFIIEKIRAFRDPDSGESYEHFVRRREEVYSGPELELAPDIVFMLADVRWSANVNPIAPVSVPSTFWNGRGDHRLNGLFLASGPGIKKNATIQAARIQDIFPTILYSLRQPVPDDVDGQVLTDIYEKSFLSEYIAETVRGESGPETSDRIRGYSETEEQAVLDRLRGLGYID